MIAVKDRKIVSFLKLEPFMIPTGSTNDFLLSDPFIVSVFVQHVRTKAVTSHLFTPLLTFIHLPLIHFALPPRLLIDFKNSKWVTYFGILLCICYCFSHLIGLLSVTWLSLIYKFTRCFYFFFVSLWRRANVRNVSVYTTVSIRVTWRPQTIFNATFVAAKCCTTLNKLQIVTTSLQ